MRSLLFVPADSARKLDKAMSSGADALIIDLEDSIAFDGKAGNFNRVPKAGEMKLDPNAAYALYTSNETIQGVQFQNTPAVGDVPLVCDSSSDILSRPIDANRFSLIYAGAQKNLGPSGVTAVLLRESWLAQANPDVAVVFYNDHGLNFFLDKMPTFAVGAAGLGFGEDGAFEVVAGAPAGFEADEEGGVGIAAAGVEVRGVEDAVDAVGGVGG